MKERNDMELKFDITEEQVEAALEAAVSNRINEAVEYRYGGMRGAVEHYLSEIIGEKVKAEASARFDEIARGIVEEFMAQPVKLNDGWSTGRTYDTYADFIGDRLRDKFSRDYDLRSEFKRQLEGKVDKVWKEYQKDAIATMLAKAEAMKAVE